MTYTLQFEIKDLPRMANPSGSKSTHWRYAQTEVNKWHKLVFVEVAAKKPPSPLERAKLTLTRFSSVCPDYDGLVRGFKSVVDGLCKYGVLKDDSLKVTGTWDCQWKVAPPKQGKIQVKVEEV